MNHNSGNALERSMMHLQTSLSPPVFYITDFSNAIPLWRFLLFYALVLNFCAICALCAFSCKFFYGIYMCEKAIDKLLCPTL